MALPEARYGVWLHQRRVGTLHQRGDHTSFMLDESYRHDVDRPVLGLVFEQDLLARHAAALRLPPWFSNLLPEGDLRGWIADDRGVSADREMELLAQVGHDLPGAVRVLPASESGDPEPWESTNYEPVVSALNQSHAAEDWRFSLAGVALKFSMLATGYGRLTLPAYGQGGDWIVKLPDQRYQNVPTNEFAMMSLASLAGIDVPEVRLVHRSKLDRLPNDVWPNDEEWAYAVRRFDRDDDRRPVHIEDLAQVRNVYSDAKYHGNYETVAALAYRGRDTAALREFARRLAFMILISSGDGHLKNWSLIYRDQRVPTLSPAYDLVATAPYRIPARHGPETLGLKFGNSRRFDQVSVRTFERLEKRLSAEGAELAEVVRTLVKSVVASWPAVAESLAPGPDIRAAVAESIRTHERTLLRRA